MGIASLFPFCLLGESMSLIKYANMMVHVHGNIIEQLIDNSESNVGAIANMMEELELHYPPLALESAVKDMNGVSLNLGYEELWKFLSNVDYPKNILEDTFVDKVMYGTRQEFSDILIRDIYKRFFRSPK